jgi:hypothetical protein
MTLGAYIFNVLIGIDCTVSALLLGHPGETLSGRAGSAYLEGKFRGKIFCPLINIIMFNPQHCQKAVEGDKLRAQAVLEQRT